MKTRSWKFPEGCSGEEVQRVIRWALEVQREKAAQSFVKKLAAEVRRDLAKKKAKSAAASRTFTEALLSSEPAFVRYVKTAKAHRVSA